MKLLTYRVGGDLRLGALDDTLGVCDLAQASRLVNKSLPSTLRGIVEGGDSALALAREVMTAARNKPDGLFAAPTEVRFCTPLPDARKNVFCVGRNYKQHMEEMAAAAGRQVQYPSRPEFFSKPPTAIVGHQDDVERHAAHTQKLDYEVELAVVIGKTGRSIRAENYAEYVFGYTVLNDITARDAQRAHGQFFKGKGFDTFCPIGPVVVTKDEFGDPGGHRLTLRVNGETRQDSNTSDLYFGVPKIIEALSGGLTLEPGDIIATGTPAGVAAGMKTPAWLDVGDVVEAEVEGIGVLRNKIVD